MTDEPSLIPHSPFLEDNLEASQERLCAVCKSSGVCGTPRGSYRCAACGGTGVYSPVVGVSQEPTDPLEILAQALSGDSDDVELREVGKQALEAVRGRVVQLQQELEETEKYAQEGWEWLDEALQALGINNVFEIKKRAEQLEALPVGDATQEPTGS